MALYTVRLVFIHFKVAKINPCGTKRWGERSNSVIYYSLIQNIFYMCLNPKYVFVINFLID